MKPTHRFWVVQIDGGTTYLTGRDDGWTGVSGADQARRFRTCKAAAQASNLWNTLFAQPTARVVRWDVEEVA